VRRLRRPVALVASTLALAAAAVGCGGGASLPPSAAPPPQVARTIPEALQASLDAWLLDPGRRGVSAAVVLADGALWTGTAGLARTGEPLRADHQIAVGSITKTATAALVLKLVEEGRLSLDDPASGWVNGLDHVPPQVTLRQLLNHTCGLANYTLHPDFAATLASDPARRFAPRELLELFLAPPVFAAGARTAYTNSAFVLLGLVAEAAGRRDVARQWRERFWSPLGLDEVFLPPDEPARGSVANAWVGSAAATQREVEPLANVAGFSSRWAAFGLVASPRDVARWARALFAGPVLAAESRRAMLSFVTAAGEIPQESGSGLGVRRYQYGGREQWGHSGAAAEGSSLVLHEPSSGVTLAVAMNQSPASHGSSHFTLAGELLRIASGR
jgi:D-alanyl-D-alanine carboxypeptidase